MGFSFSVLLLQPTIKKEIKRILRTGLGGVTGSAAGQIFEQIF